MNESEDSAPPPKHVRVEEKPALLYIGMDVMWVELNMEPITLFHLSDVENPYQHWIQMDIKRVKGSFFSKPYPHYQEWRHRSG